MKSIKELKDKEFYFSKQNEYFAEYIGKICIIKRHPETKMFELFEATDDQRCYNLAGFSYNEKFISGYTREENPEYFI